MSLRFYFGSSGAGKSTKLYDEIIQRSMEDTKQQFIVLVPDQFTMQTQKEFVVRHPRGGIFNIDILSFSRLSHRILEEVGQNNKPVLDDTGKSLILRRIATKEIERLPVLGSNLGKQGYLHEVKSIISEFKQYGIGTRELEQLIQETKQHTALSYKLQDIGVMYQAFEAYLADTYVTTEDVLEVLSKSFATSHIIRDSVVIFDGFTGFTPVQYKVIEQLLVYAKEVIVSITLEDKEDPFVLGAEESLFYLSKKTIQKCMQLAEGVQCSRGADCYINNSTVTQSRFSRQPALAHLEKHLFRYPIRPYEGVFEGQIKLNEMSTPKEETRQVAIQIFRWIKEGYCYKDIAVVVGDIESYGAHLETIFDEMQLPFYMDQTQPIMLNSFVEYLRSILELFLCDFTIESVLRYMRSGILEFSLEEIDYFENYILSIGCRGASKWKKEFELAVPQNSGISLERCNELREQLVQQVSSLFSLKKGTIQNYIEALYEILVENKSQQKLEQIADNFTLQNERAKAKEYAQIYSLVIDLFDQMVDLVGEDVVTIKEFSELLDSGLSEIQVGTIPQNVDRILIGDMTRTRLKEVKILIFMGVNDGNIPQGSAKGGILSDLDREYLYGLQWELAPTPRQQMFIQQLYLYLNVTKPKEQLYLSYSCVNNEGQSKRPSYFIDVLQQLFPEVVINYPEKQKIVDQMVSWEQGASQIATLFRKYKEGFLTKEEEILFYSLYKTYRQHEKQNILQMIQQAVNKRYVPAYLSQAVVQALYGSVIENSISRLELFSGCAYAYFLQYGLSLKERKEFGFEAVDLGNIFHECLYQFSKQLETSAYHWLDFPQEYVSSEMKHLIEQVTSQYGNQVLKSDARREYAILRMGGVLQKTVLTLQEQLRKGSFQPIAYEVEFQQLMEFSPEDLQLSKQEKMRLKGKIDRLDVAEQAEKLYVKIIDYKSGKKEFDLVALYSGLQLQLVVYMDQAMKLMQEKYPTKEVIPAALLYYHVDHPIVESDTVLNENEIAEKIREQLRMNGMVNENEDILCKLDQFINAKSTVIPVERKKDGSLSAKSSCYSMEEFNIYSNYTTQKMKEVGEKIKAGEIEINPYERGVRTACTYCNFKGACGFDSKIEGYEYRNLDKITKEIAWDAMCKKSQ